MPRKPSYFRSNSQSGASNGSFRQVGLIGWTRGSAIAGNMQSWRQASNGSEVALSPLSRTGAPARHLFSRMGEIGMPYLASVLALLFQTRWARVDPRAH